MTSPTAYAPFLAPDTTPAEVNGKTPATCKPEVTTATMTVTPDLAREWTGLNTRNRSVRYNKVAQLARDMKAGNWVLNGESIKIAADGTILDGQHRLYACIQAEAPFETLVVRGLPLEVQDTIDTGMARRMADQLTIHGEADAATLAAVARWSWRWLRGVKMQGSREQEPTHGEMLALIEAEPRIREAAGWGAKARARFRSVNPSVWGMAWLLFHGSDHLAAEVFLHKAVTGEDCTAGHPALAFRNRVLRARDMGERLNQYEQLGYLIVAWNAFKENRTLGKLLPPRGGFVPRSYPDPK